MKKIVLVGAGNVGISSLYALFNEGIDAEYILIDQIEDFAKGQARDLSDSAAVKKDSCSIFRTGTYKDCANADLLIITAGRPQREGETRLEMVKDNSLIMKNIATEVKASGFSGITIIVSNPVDILATVFQQVTQFPKEKVLSSGTNLDTARFRKILAEKINVPLNLVKGFVIGEHGDKSVVVYSNLQVGMENIQDLIDKKQITEDEMQNICVATYKEAYEIISLKRATYFGIGSSVAELAKSILLDRNEIFPIGILLDQSSDKVKGIYLSLPATLGAKGWKRLDNIKLTEKEQKAFDEAAQYLKDIYNNITL